jgi:hypothetical protein
VIADRLARTLIHHLADSVRSTRRLAFPRGLS